MKIKTVALMGAGAVGAYVIYSLFDDCGEDFFLVAEGERKERIRNNGIEINGRLYFPVVKEPSQVKDTDGFGPDLLIIATKYTTLRASLSQIQASVGKNTTVLVILNGIDSEEVVAEVIPQEQILYSFMRIVSAREGNKIRFYPETTDGIIFGEKNGALSERVKAIDVFFSAHSLNHRVSDCIVEEQWNKYGLNISCNLVQAVIGVGVGAYYDSEHVGYVQRKVIEELKSVAKAEGIEITGLPISSDSAPYKARLSTLQDLDAGRNTEVDMFLGVLLEKAQKHGIEAPFCEYTYHMIKALEEKNTGKFDY